MTNTQKYVAIGCGAASLLAIVAVVGAVLFVGYVSKDLEGASVTVDSPPYVVVGEAFQLKVTVANNRSGKVLKLSDVDIAEEYLAGFTLGKTEPAAKSQMHVPLDNTLSFTFGVDIPAGRQQTFIIGLRAEKPGIYRGDVDVCEGVRFISTMAQTVVKEKE